MKFFRLLAMGIVIFIVWNSCVYHDLSPQHSLTINLRWVKSYPTQTQEDVNTGLSWVLSFLGAELPTGSVKRSIRWQNDILVFDVSTLGFNVEAQEAFRSLFASLKESHEYQLHGGIDVGRFVMLTLNSTNHYYAITGAETKLSSFRLKYNFEERKAAVLQSSIAFGSRLIEISEAEAANKIAFIATEGEGSISLGTFESQEFETLDFMSNGQLRFALYDLEGNLKSGASQSLTAAGKPAKCLWCHEISLLPPFVDNHELSGFYSTKEFIKKLDDRISLINEYRSTLGSDIDFSKTQDHTKAELLYLSFMEPSAERLAAEWGISVSDVEDKLISLPTHPHHEFEFLGEHLYNRKDVDNLGPFPNIQIPEDPRNTSVFEPDFIH